MKIKSIIIILLILPLYITTAQSSLSIKGTVKDNNNLPIVFANVIVYNAKDFTIVKAEITNQEGLFNLERINQDSLIVKISHISFQTWESQLILKSQLPINLSTIILENASNSLDEVTITAEKPFIEMKAGKLVVSINKNGLFMGDSAFEIMEKLPGLSVDFLSGRINIQGKQGSKILINGKETHLSTEDVAMLLKNTASEDINQVEIITNPSAKYDASGNAGIINIILNKNKKEGLNGSLRINIQQSKYFSYGSGISLNFRKKKWNVYGSYNVQDRKDFTNITYHQVFQNSNPPLQSELFSSRIFNVIPQNFNLGVDYNVTDNLDINILFKGSKTKFESPQKITTTFSDLQNNVISSAVTTSQVNNLSDNYSINFNIVKTNANKSSILTFDADYTLYDRNNTQLFSTLYFDENGIEIDEENTLLAKIPSMIDIWSLRTDLTKTLENSNITFETGIKWSNVVNDNFPKYFDIEQENATLNTVFTNHFIYDETIFAAYLDFSKDFKKSTLKIGLRAENTKGIGDQKITNEKFTRSYFELFPTIFYKMDFTENHSMSLALGRRIDRPSYNDLNPFRLFLDQFSLWEGNPMLNPQFTYNFEVAHQYKRNTITKLSYSQTNDVISSIIFQDSDTYVTTETKRNLNTFSQINLSISTSIKPYSWWNSNFSSSLFYNVYEGTYLQENFNLNGVGFIFSNYNSFKISSQFSGNINGSYNSSSINGIEKELSSYSISLGLNRTSKDKRTKVRISASDIFYGRRGGGKTLLNSINRSSLVKYGSRSIRISFTYNFGKSTVPKAKRRRSGIEDEKNRTY